MMTGFPVDSKYYYLKVKGDLNKVRESRSSKGSQDYMDCNFATLMGTILLVSVLPTATFSQERRQSLNDLHYGGNGTSI